MTRRRAESRASSPARDAHARRAEPPAPVAAAPAISLGDLVTGEFEGPLPLGSVHQLQRLVGNAKVGELVAARALLRAPGAAAPADAPPTEAEKAAAKQKAAAKEAQANQALSEGKQSTEKSRDESAKEKDAGAASKAEAKSQPGTPAVQKGAAGAVPKGEKKAGDQGASLPTPANAHDGYKAFEGRFKLEAKESRDHEPAGKPVKEAQDAVEMPLGETEARAGANQATTRESAEQPPFDGAALKAQLLEKITALAPKSAEEADEFKDQGKADGVQGAV